MAVSEKSYNFAIELNTKIMQEYQLDFITYCVGNLADRLKMSASQVYKLLRSLGILNDYIIPCYDVVHTSDGYLAGLVEEEWEKKQSAA